jgi:WD40 repeat protein
MDPNASVTDPANADASGARLRRVWIGHEARVSWIEWSPSGDCLATASLDHTIAIWDPVTGTRIKTLQGHTAPVRSLAWSKGLLASSSADGTIRFWDVERAMPLATVSTAGRLGLFLSWSPDGRLLASAFDGGATAIIDRGGERLVWWPWHREDVYSVAWSPRKPILASASSGDDLVLADPATGDVIHRLIGHDGIIRCVTWSRDGRWLASSGDDTSIRVWDSATGQLLRSLQRHAQNVFSVTSSHDATLLASKSRDASCRLWRTEDWTEVGWIREPAADEWPRGLAFHPYSNVLATRDVTGRGVRLWDVAP